MNKTIGVLALQGDFEMHQKALKRLNVHAPKIRTPEALEACDGLIIPGGESTTLVKLMKKFLLFESIQKFNRNRPVFGTCAGSIVLATKLSNYKMDILGLIDITVERNAYGRQVDSFFDTVQIPVFKNKPFFEGVFIRAPKIKAFGKHVICLGYHRKEVVMARNERVLVCTFHPELTQDTRVHRYFVEEMVYKQDIR